MTTRLTLLCQAATAATRQARFPACESLKEGERAVLRGAASQLARGATVEISPAQAARETAEALSLSGPVEPELRDLDMGHWAGRSIEEIATEQPENIAEWLANPSFVGHGGESRTKLAERVERWLDRVLQGETRTIAVTHPALVRSIVVAVLDAPPDAFWRIDVAPATLTELSHDGRRWALRCCGCKLSGQAKST